MKLRVEVDGETYSLDLRRNGPDAQHDAEYTLSGVDSTSGAASVIEVMPGVFSVLLNQRSFNVCVAPNGANLEVWAGTEKHLVCIADARDRSLSGKTISDTGPVELRAQMPGKVIKLWVQPGARVQAGQSLIVVEAMKMQNEMKSPKDGVISYVHAVEGGTVAAGEKLIVIE